MKNSTTPLFIVVPPLTKKKKSKPKQKKKKSKLKYEKLFSYSGWKIFIQDKEQKNKIKDQVYVDGKFNFKKEKKLMAAEWAKCDKDKYIEKANKLNQLNLQKWRQEYARLHLETDQAEVLEQLGSAENIKSMAKQELYHFIGITGYANNIEQATTKEVLKQTLIDHLKENKDTAPELADLQELHGPLGAWYTASGLAHGEYPTTPKGLADWPAFWEMTERFLVAVGQL